VWVGTRTDKAGIWLVAVMKRGESINEPLPGVTVTTTSSL
jgi:hypothetical protein